MSATQDARQQRYTMTEIASLLDIAVGTANARCRAGLPCLSGSAAVGPAGGTVARVVEYGGG